MGSAPGEAGGRRWVGGKGLQAGSQGRKDPGGAGQGAMLHPRSWNKGSLGCHPLGAFTQEGPPLILRQTAQGEGDITLHSGNGGPGTRNSSLNSHRERQDEDPG